MSLLLYFAELFIGHFDSIAGSIFFNNRSVAINILLSRGYTI
ncbi:hypothetical protein EC2731150_3449 [Escherichia coli 2731150]|nr:hypothetical protein CSC09_4216 [Escherichia coli]EMW55290.1 hypothetical protein EC2762100_3481 [Escherichia coli 2762100]EMW76251.1 hypothetical protein EC2731150_3449 [Escherichia coli 2731150]